MNVQVLPRFTEHMTEILTFLLLEIAVKLEVILYYWDITSIDTRGYHGLLNFFP